MSGRPRRPLSILAQVTGLAVAAILTAQLVSLLVVALTPPPPAPRMSLAQARDALQSSGAAQVEGFRRTVRLEPSLPPTPPSSALFAEALAHALGAPPQDVRFVPSTTARLAPPADDRALVIVTPGDGSAPSVTLGAPPATPQVDVRTFDAVLERGFLLPAFEASWRQADGRWVTIRPPRPLYGDWRFRLALSFGISLLLVVPIAWLAARHLTGPMRTLADAAGRAELGVVSMPMVGGAREIQNVTAAIQDMNRRLADDVDRRSAMMLAIAHDLRTPLTALRLRVEELPARERGVFARQIQRMDAMVTGVLNYARGQAPEASSEFDLWTALDDALAELGSSGQVLLPSGRRPISVHLPRTAVVRAMVNLIQNALRYGREPEIQIIEGGGTVEIFVLDSGPGIPNEHIRRVIQPFERVDESRSVETGGLGLGLAIVSDLARWCSGTLTLSNRPEGGLCASLRLPLVRPTRPD